LAVPVHGALLDGWLLDVNSANPRNDTYANYLWALAYWFTMYRLARTRS
jgi:hypothetical protein